MQRPLKLGVANGFIDIGNSVVVAVAVPNREHGEDLQRSTVVMNEERRCLEHAERLMPMLQREFSLEARRANSRQPPDLAPAVAGAPRASERKPRARPSERKQSLLASQRLGGFGGFGFGLRGCWWYEQLQPGPGRHAAQHTIARRRSRPPPGAAAATEGIHLLSEDMLVHLLSHLEPADLARSSAACAFWRLAARQVMLSSPWLSHALGLQVAGEMGLTTDVDYSAFEPFFVGQPSGTGLRCLHAVKAEQTLLEYAGIALEYTPEYTGTSQRSFDSEYALGLEPGDVSRAMDILKDNPRDYRVHPAAAESLRAWLASPDSNVLRQASIDKLQQVLPRWIDARIFGNVSRFIKDENEAPNCAIGWTTASILAGEPHAYIFALQDVAAGVELSINYGPHYYRYWMPKPTYSLYTECPSQ